ncbi:MAG: LemA family protein [Verrucomicrobiota bacterium]|nr:LemA family protein [Verrucomicrobiota bacterium]
MKKVLLAVGVLVAIVVIAVIYVVGVANRFVALGEKADAQWAQVQNVYQRRADLIPNLVSTVSGAANFEKSTLTEVVEARASVGKVQLNPNQTPSEEQLQQFQQAQDRLGSALSRLLVVVERYPELRANQNFLNLQTQLEGTENRITVERNRFNETVRDYNTAIRMMPGSLIAGLFNHKPRAYFRAAEGSENAPKVNFEFGNEKKQAP